jgi:hypothetical protein
MSEKKPEIRVGYIQPITANDLLPGVLQMKVPVVSPGIFKPEFVSHDPVRMTGRTLDHALSVAQRTVALKDQMPHTELSGDLLSMAYAVLHYHGGE